MGKYMRCGTEKSSVRRFTQLKNEETRYELVEERALLQVMVVERFAQKKKCNGCRKVCSKKKVMVAERYND